MRLKLHKFSTSFQLAFILSALTWSTFPTAHSAPLDATQLTLNCKYEITTYNSQDYYSCTATDLVNNQQNAEITEVNGKHMDGYGSSNVEALIIENQNVPFLPMKIGEVFGNLTRFEVRNSSLGEILKENFEKMDLKVLKIEDNLIDKIPADAFEDLKNLEEVDLSGNEVEGFEDKTFASNEKLQILSINSNKIKELSSNLLKNLPELMKFSAKFNEIQELSEVLLEKNVNLEGIIFANNSLSQISPKIAQNLTNLKHFDFSGNPCLKDLSEFDDFTYEIDQLEGLLKSYCFKSDEDETTQTDAPEDVTDTPSEAPKKPNEDTEQPETSTQPTDSPTTTSNDTTTSDNSTDNSIEKAVNNQDPNIEKLNQKIADLEKQVEVLVKNQNLANSSVSEGSDDNQIEPPTTDNIVTATENETNNSTEMSFMSTTDMSAILTSTNSQDITLPTPSTHLDLHKDHQMSPEDITLQLDIVCTEFNSKKKLEANQPLIVENTKEKAGNITVKGFVRDDRKYLIIEELEVENSTTNIEYEKIIEEKDARIGELESKVKELEEKVGKMNELEAQVEGLRAQNDLSIEGMKKAEKNLEDQLSKIGKLTEKVQKQVIDTSNNPYDDANTDLDQDDADNIETSSDKSESDPKETTGFQSNNEKTTSTQTSLPEANNSSNVTPNSIHPSSTSQEPSLDTLESQISLLLTKIDKLILQNSKKSSKLTYLNESLKICQDNKFSLELDLKLNSMDMQDRNKTLTLFKEELDACKNKTSELEIAGRNYEMCRESNSKYENEIVELRSTNRDLQGEKTEYLEKIKGLEMQNGEQKVEIEELKGQVDENKVKVEELENQNGQQSEKIEKLERQNAENEEKVTELEKDSSDQKEMIETLEKQNEDHSAKAKELEEQNRDQTNKIDELQQQTASQTSEIDNLKSQEAKLTAQTENHQMEVRLCHAQVSNLKKETELLKIQSANLIIESNNLKAQNNNQTAIISSCTHTNLEFKTANDDLFHKNKELSTRIQTVSSQLTTCQEALTIYSSFRIDCEVENVEGEHSCVARNILAAHPNMLVYLTDQRFSSIKRVQIVNSKFRFLTNSIFEKFNDLKTLEVIKSELLDLNVKIHSNLLINLRIEGNFIQEVPNDAFIGVPNLQNLILANNEIENIQDQAFKGLSNLRKLTLRENKISTLNVNIFYHLPALTHLSLSNNRLTDLPGGLLAYQRYLQVVKFDANPIIYIGEELLDYTNELQRVYFDETCVRGTYNGIDETKLRIKSYCQRKN